MISHQSRIAKSLQIYSTLQLIEEFSQSRAGSMDFLRPFCYFLTLAFFVSVLGLAMPAQAANQDVEDLYSEEALKQHLRALESNPEDFDLLWKIAVMASQQGAYDEAITALERLLIYFPRDPKLRIELGVMYYRLGSYGQANRQFELARTLSPTQDEIARLEKFEAASRNGESGLRFKNSVVLSFGTRSNILTTATGPSILVFGFPSLIGPPQSGSFYELTATSAVTWTLDNPRADQISARVWATHAEFNGSTLDYDRQSYGVEIGYQRPVFLNFEGYALDARAAYRMDDTNRLGQSGNFDLWEVYLGGHRQTNLSRTSLGYSYTQAEQPFGSSLKTGVVKLSYDRRLSPRWYVGAEVYAGHQSGNSLPSQDVYGVEGSAEYNHKLFGGRYDGRAAISLLYDVSDANGVTPAISTTIPLDTDRIIATLSEVISFEHGFDIKLAVQVIEQDSSLPNGRYDDVVWSMGLQKRF